MPLSPDTTAAMNTAGPVRRGESIRGAFRDTDAAIHESGGDPNQMTGKKSATQDKKQAPVDLDAIFNANYNTLQRSQKGDGSPSRMQQPQDSAQQRPTTTADVGAQGADANGPPQRAPPSPPRRAALHPPAFYADTAGASKAAIGGPSRDFFSRASGDGDSKGQSLDKRAASSQAARGGDAPTAGRTAAVGAEQTLAPEEDDGPAHVTQDMLRRFESALQHDIAAVRAHAALRRRHGVDGSWRHADHCAACAAPDEGGATGARRRSASAAVTPQEQRVLLVVEGQEPRANAMRAAIDAFATEVARLTQVVEQAEADLNAELQTHASDTSALQALERRMWEALENLAKNFRTQHREASTRTQAIYDSVLPIEEVCAAAERHLAEVTVTCGKADAMGMSNLGAAKRVRDYLETAEMHNADTRDCLQGVNDQIEQEQHARGIVCARLAEACDLTAREVASAESALKAMRAQIRSREKSGGLTADLRCDGGKADAAAADAESGGGIAPLFGRLARLERHCGHLSSAGAHLLCLKCATAAVNREAEAIQRQLMRSGAAIAPAMGELDAQVAAAAQSLEAAGSARHEAGFSSAALVGAVEVAQAFDAADAAMQERAEAARQMQQAVRHSITKVRAEGADALNA